MPNARSGASSSAGAISSRSAPWGQGSWLRSTIATSSRSRSVRPVAPGRYGASQSSSVAISRSVDQSGQVSPTVRWRNATRSRSEVAVADQPARRVAWSRTRLHQRRRGGLARLGSSDLRPSRIAPRRRSTVSTRSSRSPFHAIVRCSLMSSAELGDDVVDVDGCGQPDPGPVAAAVEVGGDEERLVGERVVVGEEGARTRAQLELTRSPTRRRDGPGRRAAAPRRSVGGRRHRGRNGYRHGEQDLAARSRSRWTAPRSAASWPRLPVRAPTRSARSAGSSSGRPRNMSRSSTRVAMTHDER